MELRCVSWRQHMVGFLFLVHSATLCLIVSEFSLFPFRMIIEIWGLRAILSFASSSLVFPLLPCPCVSVFLILFGFCGFCLWFFLFSVIYFSSESLVCGYHYEYEKDSYIYTVIHFLCMYLISFSLHEFGSLNPLLVSHCYLSFSLCMLNVSYYLVIMILFLLFKLIMSCFFRSTILNLHISMSVSLFAGVFSLSFSDA